MEKTQEQTDRLEGKILAKSIAYYEQTSLALANSGMAAKEVAENADMFTKSYVIFLRASINLFEDATKVEETDDIPIYGAGKVMTNDVCNYL